MEEERKGEREREGRIGRDKKRGEGDRERESVDAIRREVGMAYKIIFMSKPDGSLSNSSTNG